MQMDDLNRARLSSTRLLPRWTRFARRSFRKPSLRCGQSSARCLLNSFRGQADLCLTEPDSPLTTGIRSCGAAAETAKLALALGANRPNRHCPALRYSASQAAVCILDEIDAALDEANSTASRADAEFSETTQLLTITHRQATMGR